MVLVVEDDININQVVCEYLKDAGFGVVSHTDGLCAKEFLESGVKIDLCVLDIMLPGLSGLELLKIIRHSEHLAQVPVMMLTALSDEQTQIASFDDLADDYVTKPFSPKIMVKRVQALLRRTGTAGGFLHLGDLVIDLERYTVTDQGEAIKLTLKEFELLKTLVVNRKKVLSRPQLLDLVWGYAYFGDDRIVDAHIKNLRRKLKSDLIQTVKGVGYRADEQV
ncbi:MAG: response regulator transcription factor [Peptococcaceae bacterium]|nr:response regulator transcription factor [Peptococcaceae bacterium]